MTIAIHKIINGRCRYLLNTIASLPHTENLT